jgi:hypothetical protein
VEVYKGAQRERAQFDTLYADMERVERQVPDTLQEVVLAREDARNLLRRVRIGLEGHYVERRATMRVAEITLNARDCETYYTW